MTVEGGPVKRPWKEGHDIMCMHVRMDDGELKYVALAAMGIVAFPDGRWSRNYTVRAIE
jgi:hypothetical protein